MKSQKWFFLYALVLTVIIFNIGIFMGYMLESSRIDKINVFYLESELELLDQRIQKDVLDFMDLNCELLFEENIAFADRIFEQALVIKRYEDANRINSNIIFQHKRYDLLRTLFWINSIRIKQECGLSYHNLVYLYDYNNPSLEQKAKQKMFSNLLFEVKNEKGNNVMLIPIAADNDLPSINLLLDKYGIEELPTILIDETVKITDVKDKEEIMKYLT